MSVVFCEGFETSADQIDVVKRGLLTSSALTLAGASVTMTPSRTGAAGTGLYLRGPYSAAVGVPCSSSAVADFGMLPLNQSVYSLWQAGGFAVGVNAGFNSLNTLQIAPSSAEQLVYDGSTYYWAIAYNGTSWVVVYSTDLKNWTATAGTVPTIVNSSVISVSGSGNTATISVGSGLTGGNSGYYSSNLGATWTAFSLAGTQSSFYPAVFATPNATTPFVSCGWIASTGYRIYTYTSAAAAGVENTTTIVSGTTIAGVAINYLSSGVKNVGSYTVLMGRTNPNGQYYPGAGCATAFAFALTSSALATASNWALTAYAQYISDVAYYNGAFYGAGQGGIYQYNIAGNTWTQVLNNGAFAAYSIASNGTLMVAVGQDPVNTTQGAIWTSTNGTTWTKQNRFIMAGALVAANNSFTNVIWDGARFIITGCLNNNLIATSTDGVAWNVVYTPDYPEQTGTGSLSFLGIYSGQQNPATGVFTPWGVAAGNVSGVGFIASAVAASARTVTGTTVTAGVQANTPQVASVSAVAGALGTVPPSTLTHYYELVFAAVAGTPNLFNVSWALDNATMGVLGQFQMASPTDTTGAALAYLNLPRNGQWTVLDDMYVTNFSGTYHNNRLGVQRIYPVLPNSDQTDQMSTTIGGATNSNTVNTALSNSEGYVYSTAATAQDIYGTTTTMPGSGVVVNAVAVEGFLTAQNSASGTGTVGLQSSGVQKLGSTIGTNLNPTRASLIQETDPNTNVPWTIAGVNAVDIVVAKTS